jgi:hypothetical protein
MRTTECQMVRLLIGSSFEFDARNVVVARFNLTCKQLSLSPTASQTLFPSNPFRVQNSSTYQPLESRLGTICDEVFVL